MWKCVWPDRNCTRSPRDSPTVHRRLRKTLNVFLSISGTIYLLWYFWHFTSTLIDMHDAIDFIYDVIYMFNVTKMEIFGSYMSSDVTCNCIHDCLVLVLCLCLARRRCKRRFARRLANARARRTSSHHHRHHCRGWCARDRCSTALTTVAALTTRRSREPSTCCVA